MIEWILLLAVWDGSEWGTMESEMRFRKQDVCQYAAQQAIKKVKAKQPKWSIHYRCVERTNG